MNEAMMNFDVGQYVTDKYSYSLWDNPGREPH